VDGSCARSGYAKTRLYHPRIQEEHTLLEVGIGSHHEEFNAQFEYTNHLHKDKFENYLGDALTNNRHRWKKHWVETSDGQYETCPDEAFAKLHKYWMSNKACIQSKRMRE